MAERSVERTERNAERGIRNDRSGLRAPPSAFKGWPEMWTNPKDGSVMRLISAGEFVMGSTPEEVEAARQMDKDGPIYVLLHETPQFVCRDQ